MNSTRSNLRPSGAETLADSQSPENPVLSTLDLLAQLPVADLTQEVRAHVSVTPIEAATSAVPSGFVLTDNGLFVMDRKQDDDDPASDDAGTRIAGSLKVTARTRDEHGKSWGQRVEWSDHDGNTHAWNMPLNLMAGDPVVIRKQLLDGGLYLSTTRRAQQQLARYLSDAKPKRRYSVASRGGWHVNAGRTAFVLPELTLVAEGKADIFLQTDNPAMNPPIAQAGTLKEWQTNVAAYAVGNSRLGLSISVAFAAPMVEMVGAESGGFHLQGASSLGKSTALKVAASVYYGGGLRGGLGSWRATDNSLEATAAAHCDLLMTLDEMGEANPATVGASAYMLANGRGKGRANQDGSGRQAAEWRVLFMSSGEVGLTEIMQTAKGGEKIARAGQEVRILDFPAKAGLLGLFETCHHFASPKDFAEHLTAATARTYGTPGMIWLQYLVTHRQEIAGAAKALISDFVKAHVPAGASGQVARVGNRFGLVAAAGEIATRADILPWPAGEATRAAAICFAAWRDNRAAGDGQSEEARGIEAVRQFLELYGDSRFPAVTAERGINDDPMSSPVDQGFRTPLARAGFRKLDGDACLYLIFPEVWKNEVCKGLNAKEVAQALAEKGHLVRGDGNNQSMRHRIRGMPDGARYYTIRSSIFDA